MTAPKRPAPPSGLGPSGKALWRRLWRDLDDDVAFDEREQAILGAACRQLDDVRKLEATLARSGMLAKGSSGQDRLHPAVTEVRLGRQSVAKLLGELDIPADDPFAGPTTASSRHAAVAANARWKRKKQKERADTEGLYVLDGGG